MSENEKQRTRFNVERETGESLFPEAKQKQLADAIKQLRVAMQVVGLEQMTLIINADPFYEVDVAFGRKDKRGAYGHSFGGTAPNTARAMAEHLGLVHFDRPVDVLDEKQFPR